MTPIDHLTTLIGHHRAWLTPLTRRVRVHTPWGAALLLAREDGLSAAQDDVEPVEFSVHHGPDLCDAVQSERADAINLLLEAWFWPVTLWTLKRRRARDWILQLGLEVDNVVHFSLPDGEHTALNINAEWVWVPGLRAIPSRHFTLTHLDMQEWLDQAVAASTSLDDLFWPGFMAWYEAFRGRTSEWYANDARSERLIAELERYDHPDEVAPEVEDDWGEDWKDWP